MTGIVITVTVIMFNAKRSANLRKQLERRISTTNNPWVLQNLSNSVERNVNDPQIKDDIQEMITAQLGNIKRKSGKPVRS